MNNIERTEAVWNPVAGCTPDLLTQPLRWRKPRMVAVNSTSDLFLEATPTEFVDRVFAVMALCPQHTFQVLTHRPERMAEYLAHKIDGYDDLDTCSRVAQAAVNIGDANMLHFPVSPDVCDPWPLPNVWLGTSVETQEQADARIPHLLRCPAALRFLSCDPLLEDVTLAEPLMLSPWFGPVTGVTHWDAVKLSRPRDLHWVIVGGECGPGARPCSISSIRSIVQQCKASGVPCYVRQLGAKVFSRVTAAGVEGCPITAPNASDPAEWPADLRVRQWPRSTP